MSVASSRSRFGPHCTAASIIAALWNRTEDRGQHRSSRTPSQTRTSYQRSRSPRTRCPSELQRPAAPQKEIDRDTLRQALLALPLHEAAQLAEEITGRSVQDLLPGARRVRVRRSEATKYQNRDYHSDSPKSAKKELRSPSRWEPDSGARGSGDTTLRATERHSEEHSHRHHSDEDHRPSDSKRSRDSSPDEEKRPRAGSHRTSQPKVEFSPSPPRATSPPQFRRHEQQPEKRQGDRRQPEQEVPGRERSHEQDLRSHEEPYRAPRGWEQFQADEHYSLKQKSSDGRFLLAILRHDRESYRAPDVPLMPQRYNTGGLELNFLSRVTYISTARLEWQATHNIDRNGIFRFYINQAIDSLERVMSCRDT